MWCGKHSILNTFERRWRRAHRPEWIRNSYTSQIFLCFWKVVLTYYLGELLQSYLNFLSHRFTHTKYSASTTHFYLVASTLAVTALEDDTYEHVLTSKSRASRITRLLYRPQLTFDIDVCYRTPVQLQLHTWSSKYCSAHESLLLTDDRFCIYCVCLGIGVRSLVRFSGAMSGFSVSRPPSLEFRCWGKEKEKWQENAYRQRERKRDAEQSVRYVKEACCDRSSGRDLNKL
jgi:hypothetical protein